MSHVYKQVPKPAPKPSMSVREAVTKHGDLWRLMFPDHRFMHRAHMERETPDSWDALHMEGMEKGYTPRIRSEDMRDD